MRKTIYSCSIRKIFETPDTIEGDFSLNHLKSILYYKFSASRSLQCWMSRLILLLCECRTAERSIQEMHDILDPILCRSKAKHDVILHLFLDFLHVLCRPFAVFLLPCLFWLAFSLHWQTSTQRKRKGLELYGCEGKLKTTTKAQESSVNECVIRLRCLYNFFTLW